MKINPGLRSPQKLKLPEHFSNQPVMQKSFSDIMQQQQSKASHEQLKQLLQQIEQQAERLSKSMTVRELRQYRQLVKRFLDETVRRGIALKETRGWDRRGRGRRYKIIEEIDRELLSLTDELLEREQGRMELLQKMGEIRGMLINLLY